MRILGIFCLPVYLFALSVVVPYLQYSMVARKMDIQGRDTRDVHVVSALFGIKMVSRSPTLLVRYIHVYIYVWNIKSRGLLGRYAAIPPGQFVIDKHTPILHLAPRSVPQCDIFTLKIMRARYPSGWCAYMSKYRPYSVEVTGAPRSRVIVEWPENGD